MTRDDDTICGCHWLSVHDAFPDGGQVDVSKVIENNDKRCNI